MSSTRLAFSLYLWAFSSSNRSLASCAFDCFSSIRLLDSVGDSLSLEGLVNFSWISLLARGQILWDDPASPADVGDEASGQEANNFTPLGIRDRLLRWSFVASSCGGSGEVAMGSMVGSGLSILEWRKWNGHQCCHNMPG